LSAASLGDCLRVVRFAEALLHRLQQLPLIGNQDGAVVGQQRVDGLPEIERMRAEHGAFAQGGRFHHVRAAHRHERPAHEDDRCQRVELPQIAHGVA